MSMQSTRSFLSDVFDFVRRRIRTHLDRPDRRTHLGLYRYRKYFTFFEIKTKNEKAIWQYLILGVSRCVHIYNLIILYMDETGYAVLRND